jgi:hypothetical protein
MALLKYTHTVMQPSSSLSLNCTGGNLNYATLLRNLDLFISQEKIIQEEELVNFL